MVQVRSIGMIYEFKIMLKKDSAVVEDFRVNLNYPTNPADLKKFDNENFNYEFVLIDKNLVEIEAMNLSIPFILLSDPPIEINQTPVYINFKYNPNVKYLIINQKNKLVHTYELPQNKLCNHDTTCNNLETYYSCPSDCETYAKDGLCLNVKDGGCDPDCFKSADPDCGFSIPKILMKNGRNIWFFLILLIIILIILLSIYFKKMRSMEQD